MVYGTQVDRSTEKLQPPQSIEAEQAVLGAILKDAEAIHTVIEHLDDESVFYVPKHRFIFRAVLDLYKKSLPCDITTVVDMLRAHNRLEKAGGRVYLVDLVEGIASAANAETHAQMVLEKALLRRLISTSNEITASCYSLEHTIDELLNKAEETIFSISEGRLRQTFTALKDLVPSTIQQVEDFAERGAGVGAQTGFTDLDILTSGLQKGDFVVVAGRPSMGKTSLAMNIAENVARTENTAVGFFSIEMSKEALALRMLSSSARVQQQKLRSGKLSSEDWTSIASAGGRMCELQMFIDDSPALSTLEMRAKARRLKAQHNVGLLVIDYIQMMSASGRYENRQSEMALISRGIKAMAKELEVPVIAVSQLSRMVEQRGGEKRPQLSDLRDSGAIEQDADVVLFVYRPEFYLTVDELRDPKNAEKIGRAEIIVSKQRNGPTGTVNLAFIKEFVRFENLERHRREIPEDAEPVGGGETPF